MCGFFQLFHTHGEMSPSQRQAVITLIPKKDKDQLLLKNWRPISLINVDYKIASKSIAKRLDDILPHIIHYNQSGYVKGRNIREAIRSILDIMYFTKKNHTPGLLLFLDFEKAFDTIDFNYLQKCLRAFGFGSSFIQWINVFYFNICSCTLNNGYTSGYFDVTRGVRQGDPLSAYLFIIGLEILSISIRSDQAIKGINVDGNCTKLVQYADDTTAALADIDSAKRLFSTLKSFEIVSGLRVNVDKSEGLWLGSSRNSAEKPFNIKWTNEPVLALGVYFSYNDQDSNQRNFFSLLRDIENSLISWSRHNISIYGRILVVKTFVISKFLYRASVLPVPSNFINLLMKRLFLLYGNIKNLW